MPRSPRISVNPRVLMDRSSATFASRWQPLNDALPRPVNVLHVIAPALVGGLERVICTLAPAQSAAGMDVRVAAILEAGASAHPVVDALSESGIDVAPIRVPSRGYREEQRRIAALCASRMPDVMHTHGYRTDLVDSAVARRLGIPRLSTFHGFTGGEFRNRVYEWLDRRAARRMDAVVAVSRPLGDRLVAAGVARDRVHVVPNAYRPRGDFLPRWAAREALGIPHDAIVVGWIGRLTAEKGADVLVDAISFLADDRVIGVFIGDGSDRSKLEALAKARAPERTRWLGLLPDASRFLPAFDAFALSSRTEGTPMVVFEAMDAGVPIVATRVGGVPDVLRPQDAVLVDSENALALAGAIQGIIADRSAASKRADSARARLATSYSTGPWVERYHEIYQTIIHRRSQR